MGAIACFGAGIVVIKPSPAYRGRLDLDVFISLVAPLSAKGEQLAVTGFTSSAV